METGKNDEMLRQDFQLSHNRDPYFRTMEFHAHDFLELYYFLDGSVTYYIEDPDCLLLMRNGSQIVSKEQLILKVWGYDSAAEDNNVEVYISFLRRKLTHLQSTVKIKTLRMVGYCLEVEA